MPDRDYEHGRGETELWREDQSDEEPNEMPHQWRGKKCLCKVIIETPKGRRNKFDYDPDYQLFALGGLLPEGLAFPFDFGFIPSTLGDDGDPLDVMVLMDEPAHEDAC